MEREIEMERGSEINRYIYRERETERGEQSVSVKEGNRV